MSQRKEPLVLWPHQAVDVAALIPSRDEPGTFQEFIRNCAASGSIKRVEPKPLVPTPWLGPFIVGVFLGFCVGVYFAPSLTPAWAFAKDAHETARLSADGLHLGGGRLPPVSPSAVRE
jgi:hypothetical protein